MDKQVKCLLLNNIKIIIFSKKSYENIFKLFLHVFV